MDLIKVTNGDSSYRQYWKCSQCKAITRANANGTPIGFDNKTMWERKKAHMDMDCYMLILDISRSVMYKRVAKIMGVKPEYAHISMFDFYMCVTFRRLLIEDLLKRVAGQTPRPGS